MTTHSLSPGQIRLAGLLYLVIILCGVSSEMVLRGPLIDLASAEATVQAIDAQTFRFRLSIMADVVMALADAALAVLLFFMLRSVSVGLALAALVFRLLQTCVIAVGLLNLQAALLVSDAERALSFIALHAYGYDLGLIFFGMNCLLTAVLIHHSGFIPRPIGLGIGLSGLVYLTGSVLRFLAPDIQDVFAPAYVVPLIAEAGFCLWLIISPARVRQTQSQT